MILDIRDYGAVANSGVICTSNIQRAIDLCPENGTVKIPAGTFVSGALFLKSNMTLYLEEGARLVGSSNISDYPIKGFPYEGLDQLCYSSLINTYAVPNENIVIEGKGIIDGNGKAIWRDELENKNAKRGRTACLRNIKNLKISGVIFWNSPAWCLHIVYCENVKIEGIEVHSKYDEAGIAYDIFNADGIDVDSCQNVSIRNSLVESEDDCIAIKSGRNEEGRRVGIPSKNIIVDNCRFTSGFGVAIGSEMSGGVEDVFVRNCKFKNAFSIASIKAIRGRGNYIRNIHYENCIIRNFSTEFGDTQYFRGAIYLDGFYGAKEFDADSVVPVDESTPIIEDIYFSDLDVETIAGNAVYLYGLPEQHYRNIYMKNIRAHGKYGMKVKNIDNLKMENVTVTCDEGKEIEIQ